MTRVIYSEDCGNSPKNIFIEKLTVAFSTGDIGLIMNSTSDDVRWNMAGEWSVRGKDALASALEQLMSEKVDQLTIRHVVTHGKAGAVDGTLELENGRKNLFCNVYEFSGAKGTSVKQITSYMIDAQ